MNIKKLTILFILSLFFSSYELNAQVRIGYPKDAIKEEFSHEEQEEGYTDSGTPFLSVYFSYGHFAYYFNEEAICDYCGLVPKNERLLHKMISLNNEDYVVVSDTEWKMYTQDGVITVVLEYFEHGTPYFLYTIE